MLIPKEREMGKMGKDIVVTQSGQLKGVHITELLMPRAEAQ